MNNLLLALTLTTASAIPSQTPPPAPPPAPPSPLLYVKVIGPEGMRVTFHPGTPAARALAAPATVGLRPGYPYRLELTFANNPKLKLYPSLEVRGALNAPLDQAMRHPVPLVFRAEEIARIDRHGAMMTKVHYLEDPLLAQPIASAKDEPPLVDIPGEADLLEEARLRGRPMVVVRVGEREIVREELAQFAVPNTILFAGDARLTLPPIPPPLPWLHLNVYDPIIGAKRGNEECLPDGGDIGARVGIGPGGKLGGFDPSDAAIEYTTEAGKRKVAVSNRICVFVPRYAVARQEVAPAGHSAARVPGAAIGSKTTAGVDNRLHTGSAVGMKHLASTTGRLGVSGTQASVHLHGFDSLVGVQIVGSVAGLKTVGQVKGPEEITAYPLCAPISLVKWADTREAQVGDVVTFYLRYTNHTKEFVDNLAVSDSLVARLEYIQGSAKSDREAALTAQANEAGSVTLRWELTGRLPPGQSGTISFQARIR